LFTARFGPLFNHCFHLLGGELRRKEREENEKRGKRKRKAKEKNGREGWKEGNGKGSLFLKRSVLRDILHVDAVRCSELLQESGCHSERTSVPQYARVTACRNSIEVLGSYLL
jgi:hypothetical protein